MLFQAEGAVHEAGRHVRAGRQLAKIKMADEIMQEHPATLNKSKQGLGDLIREAWESLLHGSG